MSEEFRPGVYQHVKGAYYRALMLGRFSENRDIEMVVYCSLTNGKIWVRPYSTVMALAAEPLITTKLCTWTDLVTWPDGQMRPRFVYIGESLPHSP